MIAMLHEMNHNIWTAFCDSTHGANQNTLEAPLMGLEQGNGVGPHIWDVVSSPLLQIMRMDGFITKIYGNMSWHKKELVGFAFVNDTDLCVWAFTSRHQQLHATCNNWLPMGRDCFKPLGKVPE